MDQIHVLWKKGCEYRQQNMDKYENYEISSPYCEREQNSTQLTTHSDHKITQFFVNVHCVGGSIPGSVFYWRFEVWLAEWLAVKQWITWAESLQYDYNAITKVLCKFASFVRNKVNTYCVPGTC